MKRKLDLNNEEKYYLGYFIRPFVIYLWDRESLESSRTSKPVSNNNFMLAFSHRQRETWTRSWAFRNSRFESWYFSCQGTHYISPRQIWRKTHILSESVRFLFENAKSAFMEGFFWGIVLRCDVPVNSDMLVKSSNLIGPSHRCKQTRWLAYYIICPCWNNELQESSKLRNQIYRYAKWHASWYWKKNLKLQPVHAIHILCQMVYWM